MTQFDLPKTLPNSFVNQTEEEEEAELDDFDMAYALIYLFQIRFVCVSLFVFDVEIFKDAETCSLANLNICLRFAVEV